MTLTEARNEIKVREEEIATIDKQIIELKDKIKERQEDWDFERKQREQDPNWRIAALDYIQSGDRSGLESYTTNRLMAEQSLVDRINGFDVEYMNLTRDEAQRNNRINQINMALERNDLSAKERTDYETQKANLESELDTIKQMKANINVKKESAIDFYERRYGKSRSQRKFGNKVENKNVDNNENNNNINDENKINTNGEPNILNEYSSRIRDYDAKIPTSYDLTDEDINEWKLEMRNEMKNANISPMDIDNLLSNVKGNEYTRLQKFMDNFDWVKRIGPLKFNGNPSESDKELFLKELESDKLFGELSPKDQRFLTNKVNEIETSNSKTKSDAEGAARSNNITQLQEWKNNKQAWVDAIKSAINLNANWETKNKAHKEAYDAVKGNQIARTELNKLGYTYDVNTGRWTYVKPSTESKPNSSNVSGKKSPNF